MSLINQPVKETEQQWSHAPLKMLPIVALKREGVPQARPSIFILLNPHRSRGCKPSAFRHFTVPPYGIGAQSAPVIKIEQLVTRMNSGD
ncbi:hypothetical protein GCM10009425_46360 [Pseudomonas asuensis]|uniref:Uncharacterized protein n=1 Tax=Pseudomonas asuensis TaxID=1825787 RepID=A0ABQ2H4I1_9PSED|nr:hypothetical protein GCM10009425_46360 [Pseudomonas asuensis]